jgi:hypothetical protein
MILKGNISEYSMHLKRCISNSIRHIIPFKTPSEYHLLEKYITFVITKDKKI